ncbi:hypothetical protein OCOJLMKI_3474 [Methylobacterium iners]|uniref:Uncharacterized protein n=1 Tax=Methylobacterium iners TaxID=418707 RepID=A0ABQ4S2W7_9HYPH|nr:hypothetical protein OCOJLMKI_3474 [Methylobacterium iners]
MGINPYIAVFASAGLVALMTAPAPSWEGLAISLLCLVASAIGKLLWRSKPKPTLKRKSPDAMIYPERAAPGRAPTYGAPTAGAVPMAPHPALLRTVRMQTSRR